MKRFLKSLYIWKIFSLAPSGGSIKNDIVADSNALIYHQYVPYLDNVNIYSFLDAIMALIFSVC